MFSWVAIPQWFESAKCRTDQMGNQIFFGSDIIKARRICKECPVRFQCLEAGIEERFGVWGGFSSQQRNRLRRLIIEGYSLEESLALIERR